jgi:hypothetical protein
MYVGLNDLQISTRGASLFDPLCNGMVETFRSKYTGAFGFAGVTRPDRGYPISCRLLLGEMARQSCDFAVARRSFRADVPQADLCGAINAIRTCYAEMLRRDAARVADDHRLLCGQAARLGTRES